MTVKTTSVQCFVVSECFEIDKKKIETARRQECAEVFFRKAANYKDKMGCYVFCMRCTKSIVPYYVGMTARSFGAEVFTPSKFADYYQMVVQKYRRGTPVMFFVTLEQTRGPVPEKTIHDLEIELIRLAYYRNVNLLNKHHIPKTRWTIKGVLGAGPGKPSKDAQVFKQMLEIS